VQVGKTVVGELWAWLPCESYSNAENDLMTTEAQASRMGYQPKVPAGWRAKDAPAGGVDLTVLNSRRSYLVAAMTLFAVLAYWKTYKMWHTVPQNAATPWLVLALVLSLFAVWCALGQERWHLETNYLEHSVGVMGWWYRRVYRDALLEVVVNFGSKFGTPYYRLYAVTASKRHCLFERDETTLQELANFISFHTGWVYHP
jgi:hypothetical protein